MATHSSIPIFRMPQTEEPGCLQSWTQLCMHTTYSNKLSKGIPSEWRHPQERRGQERNGVGFSFLSKTHLKKRIPRKALDSWKIAHPPCILIYSIINSDVLDIKWNIIHFCHCQPKSLFDMQFTLKWCRMKFLLQFLGF